MIRALEVETAVRDGEVRATDIVESSFLGRPGGESTLLNYAAPLQDDGVIGVSASKAECVGDGV
jgi:hypothetical protein